MATLRAQGSPWSLQRLMGLGQQAWLCSRLLGERRVGLLPKAVLIGALAYVVLPFDLLPDVVPGIGQLDDITLLVLAAYWFVRWCPPAVVAEHQAAMRGATAA
jgi:carbonic anhydrase